MSKSISMKALESAIEAAGGQAALARALASATGKPIRQGHIWAWLNRTHLIPAEYVLVIEGITELKVTRHELRPDLYPIEIRA